MDTRFHGDDEYQLISLDWYKASSLMLHQPTLKKTGHLPNACQLSRLSAFCRDA